MFMFVRPYKIVIEKRDNVSIRNLYGFINICIFAELCILFNKYSEFLIHIMFICIIYAFVEFSYELIDYYYEWSKHEKFFFLNVHCRSFSVRFLWVLYLGSYMSHNFETGTWRCALLYIATYQVFEAIAQTQRAWNLFKQEIFL